MRSAKDPEELSSALGDLTRALGFSRFALTHHVDILSAPDPVIRLHDYPQSWVEFFDGQRLGPVDPIHRASQRTAIGFRWADIRSLIPLSSADVRILSLARDHGLVDGLTVPSHVPGEAHGSCSFAIDAGSVFPEAAAPLAQLAGGIAFEAARRIWGVRNGNSRSVPMITDRQRDCLLWAARGKTDWEISRILGVSHDTVVKHIKEARERYGTSKRTTLLVRTLFDGTLCFNDILGS